ncbi:MAG: glycoside hydrolase family 99-like domain-containing protein [Saccharofermentanales bacterium]
MNDKNDKNDMNVKKEKVQINEGDNIDFIKMLKNSQIINIENVSVDKNNILAFNTGNAPIVIDPMFLFDVETPSNPEENLRYFALELSAEKGHRFQLIFYCDSDDTSTGITIPYSRTNSMQEYSIDLKPLYDRLFAKSKNSIITKMAIIPCNTYNTKVTIASMTLSKIKPAKLTEILHEENAQSKPVDGYIPEPVVPKTDYLIGAHYFPGWKQGTHEGWKVISPFPEKKPLLGFYDEGNPEVADWEFKWALEHGISYFVYCWYGFPDSKRGGDKSFDTLNHAIHDGLFKAKFNDKFKFAINFCAHFGINWIGDLVNDLLPYWIENYFTHKSYLVVDNKPMLFLLDFENIIKEITLEGFKDALKKMDQACKDIGFDGITVSGMFWGKEIGGIENLINSGLDAGFAYMNWSRWNVVESKRRPKAKSFIDDQKESLDVWMNAKIDYISSISFMWDPISWYHPNNGGMLDILRWRISPDEYQQLAQWTKEQMDKQDKKKLASKMLLLDNWNEYGEGHYMAPHEEYGFEYLDAIRNVFTEPGSKWEEKSEEKSEEKAEHTHLLPKEIGRGPYGTLYKESPEFRVFVYPPLVFDEEKYQMYLNA